MTGPNGWASGPELGGFQELGGGHACMPRLPTEAF